MIFHCPIKHLENTVSHQCKRIQPPSKHAQVTRSIFWIFLQLLLKLFHSPQSFKHVLFWPMVIRDDGCLNTFAITRSTFSPYLIHVPANISTATYFGYHVCGFFLMVPSNLYLHMYLQTCTNNIKCRTVYTS